MKRQCFKCGAVLKGKERMDIVEICPKCEEKGVVDLDLACDLLYSVQFCLEEVEEYYIDENDV